MAAIGAEAVVATTGAGVVVAALVAHHTGQSEEAALVLRRGSGESPVPRPDSGGREVRLPLDTRLGTTRTSSSTFRGNKGTREETAAVPWLVGREEEEEEAPVFTRPGKKGWGEGLGK